MYCFVDLSYNSAKAILSERMTSHSESQVHKKSPGASGFQPKEEYYANLVNDLSNKDQKMYRVSP
jgi:hypothetical protein